MRKGSEISLTTATSEEGERLRQAAESLSMVSGSRGSFYRIAIRISDRDPHTESHSIVLTRIKVGRAIVVVGWLRRFSPLLPLHNPLFQWPLIVIAVARRNKNYIRSRNQADKTPHLATAADYIGVDKVPHPRYECNSRVDIFDNI